MHSKEIDIKDDYFLNILDNIRKYLPSFETIFDKEDIYPIMFEFGNYLIDNIHDIDTVKSCAYFINEAIAKGTSLTEDLVVLQVFQLLYDDRKQFNNFEILLEPKVKTIYEKYYKLWVQ
jgi:hypothetical protein